jgi:glutathione reductase (NADPH)
VNNKFYDLVIIGTGTAAQVAASRVRKTGRSVAVVDHRPFGGTCALRGCDPKRMLVSGEEVADFAARMQGHGISGRLHIDWKDLIAFKRSFTGPIPEKRERAFAEQGIAEFHGHARFTGPDTICVGEDTLNGRHILIATGARPVPLQFPGAEYAMSSDKFLELDELPKRIVMIGGGYIAAEFSHLAARAGAEVTVVQRGDRMLEKFEPELIGWLMEKFDELGIAVHTHSSVTAIERTEGEFAVRSQTPKGELVLAADLVVHSAGRMPDIAELNLAVANVVVHDQKLALNEHLQSVSNPMVYAAGDAASKGPALTPVSSHDGKVVAANILQGNHREPDYRGMSIVEFTLPPLARVGLSEAEARKRGSNVRVKSAQVPEWYSARRVRETVYGYKTIVDANNGKLLGAHLVGPNAEEVINVFALAIRHDLTVDDIRATMFAYPTGASDIGCML